VRNGHNHPATQTIQRNGLSRVLVGLFAPEKPKKAPKPGADQIERTYLAAKGRGGISALYMMEEGPDSLRDLVLRESGWVRTSTLADWRFGERSDIDEITPKEAKRFAESMNLGQFVKR
jgi:hypothetical protein